MNTNTNAAPLAEAFDSAQAALMHCPDRASIAHILDVLRARVDAAISTAVQPPAGWAIVPVEPTHAQAKAAADAWLDCGSRLVLNKAHAAVRAGIAAAPKADKVEPPPVDPLDALRWGANVAETLLSIGRAIGFGRAQQILGEQWEAEHDCAPRGRMGVTVKDAPKAEPVQQPDLQARIAELEANLKRATSALQQPERVPLTDEAIDEAIQRHVDPVATYKKLHKFARAIEAAAHGIQPAHKEQPDE
ncbi:hypothetical protein [Ottowia sp. VDI28]|uniref:hypothetical protein n=1 Tax=Ottowia sp. VDI28 TaxID=3133968 RepID=UPI003C30DAB8